MDVVAVRLLRNWGAKNWSGHPKRDDGVLILPLYGFLNSRAGHPGMTEAHSLGVGALNHLHEVIAFNRNVIRMQRLSDRGAREMRLLGNLHRTSLLSAAAGQPGMLMRLAEINNIEQALLCHRLMDQVVAVRPSAMHTSSLFDISASQNMPLFDTHLYPGSWYRLRQPSKLS